VPDAYKPTRAEVAAAHDRLIDDVIEPGLRVLFCGINPGLYSAATGHHFARPGNRFWPALHRSGFTPTQVKPQDQKTLLGYGLGITNIVPRASARADELTRAEIVAGGAVLIAKVRRFAPQWLAVLGIGAYRTAFAVKTGHVGPQPETIGATHLWVLPNPSGLNAHYTLDALSAQFAALRAATTT
jgi:double-stranded uracil-DNA glycosylase